MYVIEFPNTGFLRRFNTPDGSISAITTSDRQRASVFDDQDEARTALREHRRLFKRDAVKNARVVPL